MKSNNMKSRTITCPLCGTLHTITEQDYKDANKSKAIILFCIKGHVLKYVDGEVYYQKWIKGEVE